MDKNEQQHWLVRPATITKLWIGFSVVLAAIVLAQLFIDVKGYFGFDAWFGFGAVFGFFSCVLMVFVAKVLAVFLKRPESYYDLEKSTASNTDQSKKQDHSNGI